MIKALIHIHKCGGTTFDEMAIQLELALDLDPKAESVVREHPEVWQMLCKRRERCRIEGIDLQRINMIYATRHLNNELVHLFRIDDFGRVTCTAPHMENGFDMVVGFVALTYYVSFLRMTTDIYAHWKGEYEDPNKKGDLCQIAIGAFSPYGEKVISRWTYGSQSTPHLRK